MVCVYEKKSGGDWVSYGLSGAVLPAHNLCPYADDEEIHSEKCGENCLNYEDTDDLWRDDFIE